MAVAVTASAIMQASTAEGKRAVSATLDFDTGTYVTGGIALSGLLATALGLKQVDSARILASATVNAPYTKAQWLTANSTVSYSYFVDLASPQAPLLLVHTAGAEVANGAAFAASAQVRIRFEGS